MSDDDGQPLPESMRGAPGFDTEPDEWPDYTTVTIAGWHCASPGRLSRAEVFAQYRAEAEASIRSAEQMLAYLDSTDPANLDIKWWNPRRPWERTTPPPDGVTS